MVITVNYKLNWTFLMISACRENVEYVEYVEFQILPKVLKGEFVNA